MCVKLLIYKDHTNKHGQQTVKFKKMMRRKFSVYRTANTNCSLQRTKS